MRIVIDLQGAQGDSRFRGIGRYSLDLALGIARNRGDHEVIIALSDLFPDTIDDIRSSFFGILPSSAFRVWDAPGPISWINPKNGPRRKRAEMIRETFLASLKPDVVLVTSLVEGMSDDSVTSIQTLHEMPTAVILYDLIPLIQSETYLKDIHLSTWYMEKMDHLKRADLLLSISASAREEAVKYLDWNARDVRNISTAANPMFQPLETSEFIADELKIKFGIAQKFLMYTGGFDSRKNIDLLVRAFSRLPPACLNAHHLVIAGKVSQYEKMRLTALAISSGLAADRVIITDYVSDKELLGLYNLCEAFVMPSLHEGFGLPALEAMQCGKAVISSNSTSLPEVIGREDALFDPRDERALAKKIEEVLTNSSFRRDLEDHGKKQAQKFTWDLTAKRAIASLAELVVYNSSPENSGLEKGSTRTLELASLLPSKLNEMTGSKSGLPQASEVIEKNHSPTLYAQALHELIENAKIPPRSCVQELVSFLGSHVTSDDEMLRLADSLSRNFPSEMRKPTLFVDVSMLAQSDAKTGIQRVVRAVLSALLKMSRVDFSVVPVRRDSTGRYVIAVEVAQTILNVDLRATAESPVDPSVGDVFLGLDLDGECPPEAVMELERMKRWGAKIFHVVYDLLPLQFPEYFNAYVQVWYPTWIDRVCSYDGAICISKAVADDLNTRITDVRPERKTPFQVSWFHLGADVQNSNPSRGLPEDADLVLARLKARPTFLMVGTVEPRKGYRQVISAFEQLWRKGVDANLVIVGKEGWNVVDLAKEIRLHSEEGTRLFWLENASDEYLERIYGDSNCLIAASEGEGFGLPLIEAAQHKLPILARDIPVFKEVAGKHASYFSGREPRDVSKALERWLHAWYANRHIRSDNMPWLTWDQSAGQLISIVDQWSNHDHKIEL